MTITLLIRRMRMIAADTKGMKKEGDTE
jgi:hypothetical protein